MKGCILESAPGICYKTLASVLAPMVNQPLATVAAMVADLSESKKKSVGVSWLAQSVQCAALDLRVMSSIPMFGMEPT